MSSSVAPSVLIDSNIFIAAEDHGNQGHVHGEPAAVLLRLLQQLGYQTLVSHGTVSDVLEAPEPLRGQRQRALTKYRVLERVPDNPAVRRVFPATLSSNDRADLEVVTTFATGRADWLVTQDRRMRKRAADAGIGNVLALGDAVAMFEALAGSPTVTLPAVTTVKAYRVQPSAAIFDSLRADYAGFDEWWRDKVVHGDRDVIVLGEPTQPAGIAVLKPEDDNPYGLAGDVLKICTFKIDDEYQQVKRGEVLLRATVQYARAAGSTQVYLEALPDKTDLLGWLTRFGFSHLAGAQAPHGQLVMFKRLTPPAGEPPLSPLNHQLAYGPGSVRLLHAHAVPIQARWHHLLFPDADPQGDLFAGSEACGNAIRKAYLCHAVSRKVAPGDALVFFRTSTNNAGRSVFTTLGVVEQTLASTDPEELVRFVGTRTVYTRAQVEDMCASGEVLALLFRHDRVIGTPVPLTDAIGADVLARSPQSITELSEEAVTWLRQRLGV